MNVLTLVLAAVLIVFAVLGAEGVRSACRRQLMAPLVPARAAAAPVPAEAE